MNLDESIFKAYDIRGTVPEQVTPDIAYLIGKAYARIIKPEPATVAVARDVRDSGEELLKALILGLQSEGIETTNLGVITTEMLYFAVAKYGFGGGITVSASHNPANYNGFKMVRAEARPISSDTGIMEIKAEAKKLAESFNPQEREGKRDKGTKTLDITDEYLDFVASLVDIKLLQNGTHRKIAFNGNHGMAGTNVARLIEKYNLAIEQFWIYQEPNGSFPQGRPDPLYPDNQKLMTDNLLKNGCDLGVAWDADADRCFFFDEKGNFINGYYTGAILAGVLEEKYPASAVVHDPRLVWAIQDVVKAHGGTSVFSKSGHSFIKDTMRQVDASFGAETSGHYYFRDYWYCDSGLIPFVLMLEALEKRHAKLSDFTDPLIQKYPISGEINVTVVDASNVLTEVEEKYSGHLDKLDGLTIDYPDWHASIRSSNTEPLMRINVEAKTPEKVQQILDELLAMTK